MATGQGDDFHPSIDEVIELDTVAALVSTCPASLDEEYAPVGDPLGYMRWWLVPMAIISCEQVRANPELAAAQFMDDIWGFGLTDGTFLSWCDEYGPMMVDYGYFGELDGLWLKPSTTSDGGLGVGAGYLPAPNGDIGALGVYDAWSAMGLFHADPANGFEPAHGLDGVYEPWILWIWSY